MCYHNSKPHNEVHTMENENQNLPQHEPYKPRPWWQVWGARIGLVIFLGIVAMTVLLLMRGGL
jgi:hypothetical protein